MSPQSEKPLAIITGANRGIGFETARQLMAKGFRVLLTARDARKGEAALEKLSGAGGTSGGEAVFHPLDVNSEASIRQLRDYVREHFGRADVLINNAGVLPDAQLGEGGATLEAKAETLKRGFETNTVGPFLMIQYFLPLMKEKNHGRIVNLSSGMGQLSEMEGGYPAYRISKTALNAVTRVFAAEAEGTDVLVNSVCPGWVKTDMGGEGAERSVEKGAETVVWLATLPKGGPSGGFFRDLAPIEW